METSEVVPNTTSAIDRMALAEAQRVHDAAERFAQLKAEFLRIRPSLIEALRTGGRLTPVFERNLGIVYDKCFMGLSNKELSQKYTVTMVTAHDSKPDTVAAIFDCARRGNITISPELREYLINSGRTYCYMSCVSRAENDPGIMATFTVIKEGIRDCVLSTLRGMPSPYEFREDDVEEVMRKIEKVEFRADDTNGVRQLAFVAARNWAITRGLRITSASNMLARTEAKKANAGQAELKRAKAEREMIEIITKVAAEIGDRRLRGMAKMLSILYFTVFKRENDAQLAERYPGSSRTSRDQWRSRARNFVWGQASENLRSFLERYTRQKIKAKRVSRLTDQSVTSVCQPQPASEERE